MSSVLVSLIRLSVRLSVLEWFHLTHLSHGTTFKEIIKLLLADDLHPRTINAILWKFKFITRKSFWILRMRIFSLKFSEMYVCSGKDMASRTLFLRSMRNTIRRRGISRKRWKSLLQVSFDAFFFSTLCALPDLPFFLLHYILHESNSTESHSNFPGNVSSTCSPRDAKLAIIQSPLIIFPRSTATGITNASLVG